MLIDVPRSTAVRLLRVSSTAADRTAALAEWPLFFLRVVFHSLRDIVFRLKYAKTVALQVSDIVIGVGATVVGGGMIFVIFIMSLFLGTEVGLQAYTGLQVIGAESFMGLIGAFMNVRETTPIIAAIALAAQCGSAFTAELGAMRISEEIDALEVMGINSFVYLVCTRVVAALIALVPLYLIALFASFFATRFISTSFFTLAPGVYDYYFYMYLPPLDLFYSAVKVGVFAFAVITIHCYYGYYASGGPVGVGRAAGQAIRLSIITIVTLNLLLSYVFWGQGGTVRLAG
ncbi:ABC transporter permease [Actinocorallia populi]|uniref:ABC transporter permease n=1 Tax=Actinocorallia populi TaxID=2079200 RepID=UPI000D092339|nr:ABC transporter permease [Actinocorallia populi]